MKRWMIGGLLVLGLCGMAMAAEVGTKPEPPEKLADPAADALQRYLFAQNTNDQAAMKKLAEVTIPEKKPYADVVISFQLWSRYLEKKAVEKFGKDEGMRVQGHVRTYEDQYKLDFKRVRDANIQYNTDKTAATIFLRVELNRPENLQIGDRFNFLDVYEMIKTADGWKLDFVKTYKYGDKEQEETYQSELAAFPRMTKVLKELSEQLKKGEVKSAEEMKTTYEDKWSHVYDEPIRHELKAGEVAPEEKKK